jgi:hypothetical protein
MKCGAWAASWAYPRRSSSASPSPAPAWRSASPAPSPATVSRSCGKPTPLCAYFVVLLDTRSVGVMGDGRTYAHPIVIRAVTTEDFMTADWAKLPAELLSKIATRLVNELQGVNRVLYDVTTKPPGTIEWE